MVTERHRHGHVDVLAASKRLAGRVHQILEPGAAPEVLGGCDRLGGGYAPALPRYRHRQGYGTDRTNAESHSGQPGRKAADGVRGTKGACSQPRDVAVPKPCRRERDNRARMAGFGEFESDEPSEGVARNIKRLVNSAVGHLLHQRPRDDRRRRFNP